MSEHVGAGDRVRIVGAWPDWALGTLKHFSAHVQKEGEAIFNASDPGVMLAFVEFDKPHENSTVSYHGSWYSREQLRRTDEPKEVE